MAALTLTLPPALDRFVQDQVASGAYPDADAVVAAALDRLADDAMIEADRETRYRRLIQEGLDDLDAGRYETVTDVKAWLDQLGREVKAEPR
ncbi:hypothetical protein [uncultured Brevundimonas sp.]|uniref:hypothetical protein n=1 Tax=uncultured Brevundimonas sp. TaxID=213418 RepID=UPI00261B0E87|nr:hypothetical protein [uncultured Brevundimonas sp.]